MSSNVKRLLVEKREGFDLEAKALMKDLKDSLHIDCIDNLRLLNRYDIEGLSDEVCEYASKTIFSEPNLDIVYNEKGKNFSNSLMQYKIPTRLDVGTIRVEFESSYEPTGPFGAKSIGEIVINTPSPAISNAIQNATGVIIRELPMTAEKIYRGISGR